MFDSKTLLLTVLWYVSSMMAITTSKMAMSTIKAPLCLCSVQFLTATIVARASAAASGQSCALKGGEMKLLVATSVAYTLGFWFTNFSFSLAAASFVETVKSSEPISTVILAFLLLGEVETFSTYAALMPVMVGVAMASVGDAGGNTFAFLTTLCSNFGFSARAVTAKNLKRDHPSSPCATSDTCLFFYVSLMGVLVLIPLAVMTEGDIVRAAVAGPEFDALGLCKVLALNGLMYTAYNQFSFMVLSRVSTATHAVLNVFRRVCVISFTAPYFGIPLTTFNMAGIVFSLAGMCIFTKAKTAKVAMLEDKKQK